MIQLSLTGKPQAVKRSGTAHPSRGITLAFTAVPDTFHPRFGNSSLKSIADLYLAGQSLDINAIKDEDGNNVLMSLIKAGDLETATKIINDPRTTFPVSKKQHGASLGYMAARYGTPELINLLVKKNPDIVEQVQSNTNFYGDDFILPGSYGSVTPLAVSAICGKTENALAWLANGANPNATVKGSYETDVKNAPGYTDPDQYGAPLAAFAVRVNNQTLLDALLQNPKLDTRIAMLVSILTQNTEALRKILTHPKTDIEGMGGYSRTAFYYAAFCKSDEPMKLLLESEKFKALSETDQKVILMVKGEYADQSSAAPLEIATKCRTSHPSIKGLLEAEFARLAHIQ